MEDTTSKIIIKAGTCLVKDLLSFSENYVLKIPEYQRPYVWNTENLQSLISDLEHHYKQDDAGNYYMGGLLLYKNQNTYEIIDGQQRLTTLLIIDSLAHGKQSVLHKNKDNIQFYFNSPISQKSIIENKQFLDTKEEFLKNWNKIFNKLVISIIVTNNEDESFAFFETQNNRGVKLSPVDFLKSYHLRELKNEEEKQIAFATIWDRNNKNQSMDYLYKKILWRNRAWKGKDVKFENNDLILNEFQKKSLDKKKKSNIRLYPNHLNTRSNYAQYSEDTGITLQSFPIGIQIKPKDYPLVLRQPIEKGIGFFLYSEKYNDLYLSLFESPTKNGEIKEFRRFYQTVIVESNLSGYFNDFFKLCSMSYHDKFGTENLLKFGQYLDYLLGAYRLSYSSIVERTPVKILRDSNQNLLDVISNAFMPEEVFEFLESIADASIYEKETEKLDHRVKGKYKQQQLKYYKSEEFRNLLDKEEANSENSTWEGENHLKLKLEWIR